jgi:hypothetical protein
VALGNLAMLQRRSGLHDAATSSAARALAIDAHQPAALAVVGSPAAPPVLREELTTPLPRPLDFHRGRSLDELLAAATAASPRRP